VTPNSGFNFSSDPDDGADIGTLKEFLPLRERDNQWRKFGVFQCFYVYFENNSR